MYEVSGDFSCVPRGYSARAVFVIVIVAKGDDCQLYLDQYTWSKAIQVVVVHSSLGNYIETLIFFLMWYSGD